MSQKEAKKDFIERFEEDFEEIKRRFESLRERVQSSDEDNEADLKSKYQGLEEKVNSLAWRIENFKKSQVPLDEQVKESFRELFDELSWRCKSVEAAMKGKEVWESKEASKRGKKLFEE